MPLFTAKIKDPNGQVKTISRQSESRQAFAAGLRSGGNVVLSVTESRASTDDGEWPSWHPAWLKPVTSFDLELGFRQLGSMLKSGISLMVSLETVAAQSRIPRAAKLWQSVNAKVSAGTALSAAMEQTSSKFNEVSVQLVKVGEHAGELDTALIRAAEQLETQRNLRMMVANAVTYPVFATVMALGVSVYLVAVVIPKISEFLESSGAALPPLTRLLMDISFWMRTNGLYLLGGIVLTLLAVAAFRLTKHGRDLTDLALLRMPVAGPIMRLSGTAVFSRAMSMLVESGVTLLDALTVTGHLLANSRLARRVAEAKDAVIRGGSLADALKGAREFMPMLRRMAAVGETTGSLGESFAEVARFHEMMLAVAIKRFSITIEPAMIFVTAVVVGFVYLAFFMALFSMAGAA